MNLTWVIVISLIASIVGGIFAGLFVMRKITHDNKRSYANQIYYDFWGMYPGIALSLFIELLAGYTDMKEFRITFNNESTKEDLEALKDKKKIVLNSRDEYVQTYLSRYRQWLRTDAESELSSRDEDDLIDRIDELFENHARIKDFIAKYPTQASYFDKLYKLMPMLDELEDKVEDLHLLKNDGEPICSQVVEINIIMLDIVEGLVKVNRDIQYYRKAKSWTWRLFLPRIRN